MKTIAPFSPAFIYGFAAPLIGFGADRIPVLIILAWAALAAGLYISIRIYKWEEPAREAAWKRMKAEMAEDEAEMTAWREQFDAETAERRAKAAKVEAEKAAWLAQQFAEVL